MIKKSYPIKKPYFYDTKEGIDHFTKLSIEDNPKKLTPKELADIHKVGRDMKKAALNHHSKEIKQFRNDDPSTFLTDPLQRGRLLEIGKLEKDLAPPKLTDLPILKNNINRPVKRNYWDDTVKLNVGNKGPLKLPELTPEEIERANRPSDWDVIYASMSPFEKGQWNNEQRRKKLKEQKEAAEDKKVEAEEKRKYGTFGSGYNSKKMAEEVVSNALKKIEIPRVILPEVKEIREQPELPFNPPLPKLRRKNESGIHEGFVREKLREGQILKQIEKEIKNEI